MKQITLYQLILISIIFSSCTDDDPEISSPIDNIPNRLTSSTYVTSRNASELNLYLSASSLDLPADLLQYDVDLYRLEYTTTYKGQEITASGIVLIPQTSEPVPVLSYQHGTIAANREAPSQLALQDAEILLYQGIAAAGFLVVVPDYIGFGASNNIMHPYYVEDLTASTIIDQIYGAANLARDLEIELMNTLYLAGYSQGGYATLATHKFIEEQGINGFELKASFSSSGGYDVKDVQDYFFQQEVYHQPFFLAYVAHAYHETLDLETNLSDYFSEPYASAIPKYFDGTLSGTQINNRLNDTLSVLVNPDYFEGNQNTRYQSINLAFAQNSLLDWSPAIRLLLYHGDADITVPYQNSIRTYNRLIENGASESVVTFTPLEGATHGSGYLQFLEAFLSELILLEEL